MRIIAGTARGRTILGPKAAGLRPTSDRVRESLFNILRERVPDARVLDLFAGTGALSFEALSRGARQALLVDKGREALRLCRENGSALGFGDRAEILSLSLDAKGLSRIAPRGPFELIFADPPYAAVSPAELLDWLEPHALLADDGVLVIEHDRRRDAPAEHGALERYDARRFGDTAIAFYRHRAAAQET